MKNISAINGKKGGRPNCNSYTAIFIPYINLVLLTQRQYNILLDKYGNALFQKALSILDNWLQTSRIGAKYKGKNNYAHFREDGWVINEARLLSIQQI